MNRSRDGVSAPGGRGTGAVEALLAGLNPRQREAVTHEGGALLVLAGAGSGKTRVITHRIAHLVLARGIPPERIFAVTFTNKAAGEMRDRVQRLLGADYPGGWTGTFHALCLRLLRRHGRLVGLESGFNVYDSADQLALVKRLLRDEEDEGSGGSPRSFLSRISRAKNALDGPEDLERRALTPERKLLASIYRRYQDGLKRANAVDFDDLLVRALDLLRDHPEVAVRYSDTCLHLLVDEYQDTNRPQYLLVRALSAVHGNVCVVGDEDQSIYRFRGAEIRNILEFEHDHPGAVTVRLEQNYRSTGTILAAAGGVIAHNVGRKGKTLWTENPAGAPVELFRARDDREEAGWIARRAKELEPEAEAGFDGIAVLYRTNAQSRQLEEAFRAERIPFRIVGSVQFYERREIKDLLAYLKLAANPADDLAFRRVVNTPVRGIGESTRTVVDQRARHDRATLWTAASRLLDEGGLPARATTRLRAFVDLITDLASHAGELRVPELLEQIVERVGYVEHLRKTYGVDAEERIENIQSLIGGAVEYEEDETSPSLEGFLDRSALVSDADDVGAGPGVTLMTIHCAKGLEYPAVFLAGLEENLFPHAMASDAPEDLEEERRLCYVAMTRARSKLMLTQASFRRLHGQYLPSLPSRFLDEIPAAAVREIEAEPPADAWDAWQKRSPFTEGSSAARAARRRVPEAPTLPIVVGDDPGDGMGVGALVVHPKFGSGRIVGRQGKGKNLKLSIHFSAHGTRKILPSYTRLQVRAAAGRAGATAKEGKR